MILGGPTEGRRAYQALHQACSGAWLVAARWKVEGRVSASLLASLALEAVCGEGHCANLRLVALVLLGADVDVIVAEGEKLALHVIDRAQRVDLQRLHEVDIVPDDVLPELRGEQRRREYQRLPIEVSDLNLARYHDELEVDEPNDYALSGQLHLVHNSSNEPHHVLWIWVRLLVRLLAEVEVEERHRA